MGTMAPQITGLTIVYSTIYSGVDHRKHQSSASLAFVRGIHRGPVNSPHKWPVTRKVFPSDDVIMMIYPNCFVLMSSWWNFGVKNAGFTQGSHPFLWYHHIKINAATSLWKDEVNIHELAPAEEMALLLRQKTEALQIQIKYIISNQIISKRVTASLKHNARKIKTYYGYM